MSTPARPPDTADSTPDPVLVALVLRLVRWLLTLAAAFGFAWGTTLDAGATPTMIATALVGIGTAAWSIVEWVQNARHAHATAVLSAGAGRPVQPSAGSIK